MSEYLDLVLDVFDETDQRASVRRTLTVDELISEIIREFDGLDKDLAAYGVYREGQLRPLQRTKTLTDQAVQPGERLVFDWDRDPFRQLRGQLTEGMRFALREATTQVLFPIDWQPALIGRPDADPAHNELLAVNLSWLSGGQCVSRRHAQITEREGMYYIEALAERNPTFLNGQRLSIGRRYEVREGDTIGLGSSDIRLTLITQG